MSQQIPFLEELKQDLLEHAPGRPEPVRPLRRPRLRGAWLAAAVFMGVLLVGGLTWVLRSDAPPVADHLPIMSDWDVSVYIAPVDDADGLLAEIDAIPGVVEAGYVADITDLQPETAGLNIAAVLVRIDAPENAEPVATEINSRLDGIRVTYSEEIAAIEADAYFDFAVADAAVLGENPLIVQPPLGPEPDFDTSGLGVETSMIPAQSPDEIADTFLTQATGSRMEEHALDPDGPVIHIGYLEEADRTLIVYGTTSNGYCVWAGDETGAGGSSCGDFSLYPFGVVMVGSGSGGNEGNVSVRVPGGTSVVTLSIDGNGPHWQRPRAGWTMFPLTVRDPAQYTVEAYSATGGLIGRWEQSGG